jgi:midasin (ATPase involved in ribosome maturation)
MHRKQEGRGGDGREFTGVSSQCKCTGREFTRCLWAIIFIGRVYVSLYILLSAQYVCIVVCVFLHVCAQVLEALNRLLDDNRELYIPETQEVVKPHPHFMLFATQNPPGLYGGRKVLSRAFRNRFLELHIDDIPARSKKAGEPSELEIILKERTSVPPSHCATMVRCMLKLQEARQRSNAFAGKHGFITPRDLLRWAERCPGTKEELAREGYLLLSERLRLEDEKAVVRTILQNECGLGVEELDLHTMYHAVPAAPDAVMAAGTSSATAAEEEEAKGNNKKKKSSSRKRRRDEAATAAAAAVSTMSTMVGGIDDFKKVVDILESVDMLTLREESGGGGGEGASAEDYEALQEASAGLKHMVFTQSLQRLFALVGRCIKHQEPVLLVGETGCGKTTVCQLYSILLRQVVPHTQTYVSLCVCVLLFCFCLFLEWVFWRKKHFEHFLSFFLSFFKKPVFCCCCCCFTFFFLFLFCLAFLCAQRLVTVNCHTHTETADLIGNLRPLRNQNTLISQVSSQSVTQSLSQSVNQSLSL